MCMCVYVCLCPFARRSVDFCSAVAKKKRTFAVIAQLNLETPSCHSRKQLSSIVWLLFRVLSALQLMEISCVPSKYAGTLAYFLCTAALPSADSI